jgi:transposase-like protein
VYVSAGLKGCKRDQESHLRGLSTNGHGTHNNDKPQVFTLVDHRSSEQHVVPENSTEKTTVWLLLADRQWESLASYTRSFERMI